MLLIYYIACIEVRVKELFEMSELIEKVNAFQFSVVTTDLKDSFFISSFKLLLCLFPQYFMRMDHEIWQIVDPV